MSSVYIFVLGRLVFLKTGLLCSIVMQVHTDTPMTATRALFFTTGMLVNLHPYTKTLTCTGN